MSHDDDDLCLWPDGTFCTAQDLPEYLRFMSDDYERIPYDSERAQAILMDDLCVHSNA